MSSLNERPRTPFELIRFILKDKRMRIGIITVYTGFILLFVDTFYNKSFYTTEEILKSIFTILHYIIIVVGVGFILISYLEGGKRVAPQNNASVSSNSHLEKMIAELKYLFEEQRHRSENKEYAVQERLEQVTKQIESLNNLRLDDRQKSELFNSLKQSFTENVNKDFFVQLNENISIELTKEKRSRLDYLLKEFHSIKSRLNNEIDKLSRRADVNLVIGSLTTIVALITLGFIVFQSTQSFNGYVDMIYHYIPRLSLIIFVEVFAYFFLKLYKGNLSDMKYYQNELTTVELKLASITTAIHFGKDIDVSSITSELSRTERNFILKKDETTVEIEKTKLEKADLKDILKFTTDIVNKRQ